MQVVYCDITDVSDVCDNMLKSHPKGVALYSVAQKQLLVAISKEGKACNITSVGVVKAHSLKSPSTVQSAARALYDADVITRVDSLYPSE